MSGAPGPILPYTRRPAAGDWLEGRRAACLLTFDVDAESPILGMSEDYARDLSAMSHQAYGPLVGVPRILELLARRDLPATFFVPGRVAELWPDVVAAILDAGHEVGFHSHMHKAPLSMSAAEEREDFERGLDALRRAGAEPAGFRASYWQLTEPALEAVVANGLVYDSSLMDDDRPYRLRYRDQEIAELPVHWLTDDWTQYAYLPEPDIGGLLRSPAAALELWTAELDAMRDTGSLYVATAHPFVSGRPSRMAALERLIEFAAEKGDVLFSRCDRVAAATLGQSSG